MRLFDLQVHLNLDVKVEDLESLLVASSGSLVVATRGFVCLGKDFYINRFASTPPPRTRFDASPAIFVFAQFLACY